MQRLVLAQFGVDASGEPGRRTVVGVDVVHGDVQQRVGGGVHVVHGRTQYLDRIADQPVPRPVDIAETTVRCGERVPVVLQPNQRVPDVRQVPGDVGQVL